MWSFLLELARRTDGPCTVLVMDDAGEGDPLEFRLFGCGISLRQEHARFFTVSSRDTGG